MRKLALIGGIGYLVIFISGIYANFMVLESLRSSDFVETYQNMKTNATLFVQGTFSFVVMVLADLVLTYVLFVLFLDADAKRSSISAVFRFINVVFFGLALYYLFDAQSLLYQQPQSTLSEIQMAIYLDENLKMFDTLWLIGLVFFGIHLILLSKVICTSKKVHKSISALLFIAGIGYVVDSGLQLYYPSYESIEHISTFIVVLPGLIGELSLTFWLLLKGGKSTSNFKTIYNENS
jgi:hypothetical protein